MAKSLLVLGQRTNIIGDHTKIKLLVLQFSHILYTYIYIYRWRFEFTNESKKKRLIFSIHSHHAKMIGVVMYMRIRTECHSDILYNLLHVLNLKNKYIYIYRMEHDQERHTHTLSLSLSFSTTVY